MTMKRHIVPVLIIIMPAALGFSESAYKFDRFTQVRIGKGGPAIECDTLNGDILIKKSH